MSGEQLATLLLAVFAGAGASLVTGLLSRPKVTAEASAAHAGGEVSISGDAREWARTFAEKAEHAEQRAEKAELRAKAAEVQLERVDARCDELDTQLVRLSRYTNMLQRAMRDNGIDVPEPPFELPDFQ